MMLFTEADGPGVIGSLVFIAAAVWLVLHLLMTRTALGLFIQAIGINPAAARLAR